MAIKAVTALSPFWFTPESEKDSATAARFNLRALKEIEWNDVEMHKDRGGRWRSNSDCVRHILCLCLLDWQNVIAADGQPILFDKANKEANIEKLPFAVLDEIYSEILAKSTLTETERKN